MEEGVYYLVLSRESAELHEEVAEVFKDYPEIQVIVDRRIGDRRKANIPVAEDQRKTREDRRKRHREPLRLVGPLY
ncbi:MAG: hypothetical protein HY998_03420 [candidate division NC10 bacterium]|nr:hypothetical protein [candidate division NC10 bacterium]